MVCAYIFSVGYQLRTAIKSPLLFFNSTLILSGLLLVTIGSLSIVFGQKEPEPAPAGEVEGVCCVAFPEQLLLILPPEPAFAGAPEAAVGTLPEVAITDPGQIAPIPALDPESMEADYDDTLNRLAAGNLLRFIEGAFGALIMIGAGLGAIIAGAFGAYKAALSLLFVAVGAFILRALVSLFFGTDYPAYGGIEFVGGL